MTENAGGFWTEVSLRVRPAAVEDVATLLQDFSGAGVAIEPPIEALGPDEGYVLDERAPHLLRAYHYGAVSKGRRVALRRRLRERELAAAVVSRLAWRTLREEDWAEAWKAHYDIERLGRVVIRPAWRAYEPQPGDVVVSLDPGMAFGSGQHATTRMCVEAMQRAAGNAQPGAQQATRDRQRGAQEATGSAQHGHRQPSSGDAAAFERRVDVLDLGCGSGILAIAAVALGARRCLAVDIEEQAVAAAVANAALNGLEERISVRLGSLDAVAGDETFDLVLANINAATVIALAAGVYARTRLGGVVVASGIIADRAPACEQALLDAGFAIEDRLADGDWRAIVARRQ